MPPSDEGPTIDDERPGPVPLPPGVRVLDVGTWVHLEAAPSVLLTPEQALWLAGQLVAHANYVEMKIGPPFGRS